jgi:hypothetical protein
VSKGRNVAGFRAYGASRPDPEPSFPKGQLFAIQPYSYSAPTLTQLCKNAERRVSSVLLANELEFTSRAEDIGQLENSLSADWNVNQLRN